MIFLAASAALVGFIHSLAPGHWLPVVLLAKARKWSLQSRILAAAVAAAGHILISNSLGFVSIAAGHHFLEGWEEDIERYGSLLLVIFGAVYAANAYFRHSHCHGHSHHGPAPHGKQKKTPYLFLFSLGFSPCVAVLPVFITASAKGMIAAVLAMVAFSIGVLAALISSTVLVTESASRAGAKVRINLDHPILEHYGDVITGVSIVMMGVILFFIPI